MPFFIPLFVIVAAGGVPATVGVTVSTGTVVAVGTVAVAGTGLYLYSQSPATVEHKTTTATTTRTLGGPHNVYDVHILRPGTYSDYTRGAGFAPTFLSPGAIYKYGRTIYGTVLRRYYQFRLVSPKELMIYTNLLNGTFGAKEWYVYRVSLDVALTLEAALISTYLVTHGKFPPGNTGVY